MNEQLSVVDLLLQASLVVQLVMLLLAGASVLSWAIIFRKRRLIGAARQEADRFEAWFWSGVDLGKLFKSIESRGAAATGMESIFHAGFSEFTRVRGQTGLAPGQLMEGVRRAMHVEQLKEIDQLEESLATLATIGSTSPYVGLFGTVWGIMNAFHGLGNVQQATLAMVAPGIAEALIATAMGLFAAIPAVIAYNRFADRVSRLELRYDTFMEEFTALLQRHSGPGSG
ncbi:MAG: protein tolQ [Proteobacteria bacterium]|nr:protein tolQ [Pseudomonadota bacterium]